MGVFGDIDSKVKKKVVKIWSKMKAKQRDYFIDQVALALSVWGSDEGGRRIVTEVLNILVEDGSENLSDFGLYVEKYLEGGGGKRAQKVRRAGKVIEDYRLRNALSSVPHKEWGL